MTATTRNEAAERLTYLFDPLDARHDRRLFDDTLRDALAAERRATVERIRFGIWDSAFHANNPQLTKGWEELDAILDEEAQA